MERMFSPLIQLVENKQSKVSCKAGATHQVSKIVCERVYIIYDHYMVE